MANGRPKQLEFATCICKFGEKNLLDGADQVFLPAIFSGKHRKHGKTEYFFHDPAVVDLPDGELGVAFQLVKNTLLHRDQVFDPEQGLIEDPRTLESAPSSMVLLILNDHRIVFLPVTRYAPTLKELESTLRAIVGWQWKMWVADVGADTGLSEARKLREQRRKELPEPRIEVVPLSSRDAIEQSFDQFEIVTTASFQLVDTNNEYDPSPLFKELRERKTALASERTKLIHTSKEGLSKEELKKDVETATQQGTTRVTLRGENEDGDRVTQDNTDLRVRTAVTFDVPDTPREAATDMQSALRLLEESGRVKPANINPDTNVLDRVVALRSKWKKDETV